MDEQRILAISGKKSGGKNTACNFIHSLALVFFKCTTESKIDPDTGELIIKTAEGDYGIMDLNNRDPEYTEYMNQFVHPFIRKFSFADPFKEFCIDAFGLTEEQCYGTNEQKNSLTHLKWEDMPIPHPRYSDGSRANVLYDLSNETNPFGESIELLSKTGFMTAREFMQYFGSQIGREIDNDVWAKATIRRIRKSLTGLAIVDDCRFPNEVDIVQNNGGKVIRLTRDIHGDDAHESEHALNRDVFDWNKFDKVIDNQNLTIYQTCDEVYKTLVEWGWIEIPPKTNQPVKRNAMTAKKS